MNTKTDDDKRKTFRESRLRSFVKSLVYRVISIIGTSIISWIITRDIGQTVSITIVIQVFLIILYYTSERIWDRIGWGRQTYSP